MKTRISFVANSSSSSSSFIIPIEKLSLNQIDAIENHISVNDKMNGYVDEYPCPWSITTNEFFIEGYTSMDNFDMGEFFEKIGIDKSIVKWSDYHENSYWICS